MTKCRGKIRFMQSFLYTLQTYLLDRCGLVVYAEPQ